MVKIGFTKLFSTFLFAVLCPAIGDEPNRIKRRYDQNIGGITEFACTGSYVLRGVRIITCGSDGRWSNKEPICYSEDMVCGTCVCSCVNLFILLCTSVLLENYDCCIRVSAVLQYLESPSRRHSHYSLF